MDNKKITVKELQLAMEQEFTEMVQEVVEAMNNAKAGSIIADSEEPVRDANAKFKQQIFQKALGLLQKKQEAFPPSAQNEKQGKQACHTPDD
jgi:hypothetical protein